MSAFLKVFTDAGATSEVSHTTQNSQTMAAGAASDTVITFQATPTGFPAEGVIDIIDGVNGNETIAYYGLSGLTANLASPLAHLHPAGTTVNQWAYVLDVGDQVNGIPNDGTNSTPNSPTNVGTWYVKNTGDQIAQNVVAATANISPTTTEGFADTQISKTSASAGFAASVTVGNMAVAAIQQIWIVEEIPLGQSAANNPNQCVIDLTYGSV